MYAAARSQPSGRGGWRNLLLWLSSPAGGKVQLAMLATMVMMGMQRIVIESGRGLYKNALEGIL